MKVGIVKEIAPGERRVAGTPDTVQRLLKLGFQVQVEAGAGDGADIVDAAYERAGATIVADDRAWSSDVVLKVRPPADKPGGGHEVSQLGAQSTLVSFLWPAQNPALVESLGTQGATALAMDCVPRISRAQKCDALSSMANIAGYRAVVEAAHNFGRFFTGQVTAAGSCPPAKVLIIGAGVAGLAAIGAARSLGAIVRAFDTRPAVKEQVESMGAEFLELDFKEDGDGVGGYAKEMSPAFIAAEMALFAAQAKEVDIIITTALIPGKPAPKLISKELIESMRRGSVLVDLAAEQGGNCELTVPGQLVNHDGRFIVGFTDLTSRMAAQSSQLYGTNLVHLLAELGGAEKFRIDLDNELVRGAVVLDKGKLMWPPPKPAPAPTPAAKAAGTATPPATTKPAHPASSAPAPTKSSHGKGHGHGGAPRKSSPWPLALAGLALLGVSHADPSFLSHLTVFVLACFVGWQLVWNVAPALHTPLMSVTNAISGIILIGGMLQVGPPVTSPTSLLGAAAVLVATINISGGFLVTRRMLGMFQR